MPSPRTCLLGFALLGTVLFSCSYWYTVAASLSGPSVSLDVETPGQSFVVRACVEEATPEDLALSVVARAQAPTDDAESPAEMSLTLQPPGGFGPAASSEEALDGAAGARLIGSVHLDSPALAAACESGLRVDLERIDGALLGRVDVEWQVQASAGSPSPDIEAADLRLEIRAEEP